MTREYAPVNFTAIDEKKQRLDAARPLPQHTMRSLREHALVEWTYNSNAIEGNTLTLSETRVVLEGITVGGKTVREHFEVINHRDAIHYLEELVRDGEALSEWQIRNLHQLVLKGVDDTNAGVYRTENVLIAGASHRPPGHFLVQEEMLRLIERNRIEWSALHPVECATLLHGEFVKIHPFVDGNGRTARLLMNFELLRAGFPPAVIRADARPRYYDALDTAAVAGDYSAFLALVAENVEASLDLWLSVL